MKGLRVQYGCGLCAPETWRNFDASPTLRLQRIPLLGYYFTGGEFPVFPENVEYGDIVKGLPVPAESCTAIYCSHTLEHLSLNDFRTALKNTHSYLESKGIFRLVVPDLEQLARDYVNSSDAIASISFMERSELGKKSRPSGLRGFLRDWLGNSAHLWMWDFKSIVRELEQSGYRNVRLAKFGDSQDPSFRDVEDIDRWTNCLGVECSK
jgi:hypothetical protein